MLMTQNVKKKSASQKLYEFEGLDKVDVKNAQVGSIVAISGISDLSIGDTICDVDGAEAIPFQKISGQRSLCSLW